MTILSTRGRSALLVVLAGLPMLALTVFSTWDERARSELQAREDLQRLATNAAHRQQARMKRGEIRDQVTAAP